MFRYAGKRAESVPPFIEKKCVKNRIFHKREILCDIVKKNVYGDNSRITLETGTVITFTSYHASMGYYGSLYFDYNGESYKLLNGNDAELIVPVK